MANFIEKAASGVAEVSKKIVSIIRETLTIAAKVEKVLKAEKPLQPSFIAGVSSVIADVESLAAFVGPAVSSNGLNFAADSKVYEQFIILIDDFRKLTPVVEEAVTLLKAASN
jgi:prophage DNA circulation protein